MSFLSATEVDRLVGLAKTGDRDALARLFKNFAPLVRKTVGRVIGFGNPDLDDVCQEVYILVMRKIGQYSGQRRFGGWLKTVARNQAIIWIRKQRETVALGVDPADTLTVDYRDLHAAVDRLAVDDRDLLRAFYWDRRKIREIAADEGQAEGSIKRRLHWARRRLAANLRA